MNLSFDHQTRANFTFCDIFRFLTVGGWDTLNDWLQDIKEDENYPVLVELLKVYQNLPVSVDILKTNNAAKTIKQLCKSENEGTNIQIPHRLIYYPSTKSEGYSFGVVRLSIRPCY